MEKDSFGSGPPLTWLTSPPPTSQSDRSPSVLYGCFLCKTFWGWIGRGFQFSVTTSHFAVFYTRVYSAEILCKIYDKIGRDFHSLGLLPHHKLTFLPVLVISHWEAKYLTWLMISLCSSLPSVCVWVCVVLAFILFLVILTSEEGTIWHDLWAGLFWRTGKIDVVISLGAERRTIQCQRNKAFSMITINPYDQDDQFCDDADLNQPGAW